MPDNEGAENNDPSPFHVLFLCTGNICRSPLAQVIAQDRFGETFRFTSAGTHAIEGTEATEHTKTLATERGLDLSSHSATLLANCSQPDAVIGMEQHHLVAARHQFPELDVSRIRLLAHPVGITDPYLRSFEVYRAAAQNIDRAFDVLHLEEFQSNPS
jgi:protein arginine phosphatase